MMEKPTVHSPVVRLFFFWCGIIATFAYRIIVVLNNFSEIWVQIAWYIGTIGFILYFWHRFQVSEKRTKLIEQYKLREKVNGIGGLSDGDKDAMEYIFNSVHSSKERINYIFIFVVSFLALIVGIYLDFIENDF